MTNPGAAKAGDAVISIRGVSMSYGSRPVLDRVDLDTVTAMGMVVAELVANSFDHAFPGGAAR